MAENLLKNSRSSFIFVYLADQPLLRKSNFKSVRDLKQSYDKFYFSKQINNLPVLRSYCSYLFTFLEHVIFRVKTKKN